MFMTPGSRLARQQFPASDNDGATNIGGSRTTLFDGSPANENQEGKVWSWVPKFRGFRLRHPKQFFGPMALDTGTTGPIGLTNNTWVPLYSGIPGDGIGFRKGMVQYVPKGRYGMRGQILIATPSTSVTYHARVRQGNSEDNPGTQPRIAVGTAITVGGGCQASHPTASVPFTLIFEADDIQVGVAKDHAAEIWVEVYAESAGAGAGSALAAQTLSVTTTVTKGVIWRWDGLYG